MYFNNFFVENFVKYNAKVEKFMCSSIDSMLRYTKGKHQVQDIKPTTLQSITDVSSKALLLEPVCKVLFLNQNLQVGVKQMISIKSESAQENIKPKKVKEEGRLQELPNDRTYRIIHIGLCLSLLIFCQTKSDSQHRFTNYPRQLFFSDM